MENLYYESKPYLFGIIAMYALISSKNSLLMNLSGTLFLVSSCCIFHLRQEYRKKNKLSRQVLKPSFTPKFKK